MIDLDETTTGARPYRGLAAAVLTSAILSALDLPRVRRELRAAEEAARVARALPGARTRAERLRITDRITYLQQRVGRACHDRDWITGRGTADERETLKVFTSILGHGPDFYARHFARLERERAGKAGVLRKVNHRGHVAVRGAA